MVELSLSQLKKRIKNAVVKNTFYLASNYVIPKLTDETIIKISDKLNNFKAPAGKIFFDRIFINLKRKLPYRN